MSETITRPRELTPEQRTLQSLRDKLGFIKGELRKFQASEGDAPSIADALDSVTEAHAILSDLLRVAPR